MGDSNVVLSSKGDDDNEYVELARTPSGKVYRKQILKMNESFLHPANKAQRITIDQNFAEQLVNNFKAGYCDTVQFPKVNEKNQHVEDPDFNMGEVIDLTYDDKGVWAYIDVRKNADDIGKTYLGASAMMSLDYEDHSTGNHVGPTLLHVAATNRPYLTNLAPYESVSLSNSQNNDNFIVMLSEDENTSGSESDEDESRSSMDRLEELLKELSDVYDIDVEALQKAQKEAAEAKTDEEAAKADKKVEEAEAKVEDTKEKTEEAKAEVEEKVAEPVAASADSDLDELIAKLSDVLKSADPNLVSLSDSEVSVADLANGVIELSNNYKTMSNTVGTLNRKSAEADVDEAVRAGKILPAQRDAYVELKLSNESMYESLIPETAIVSLSNEKGVAIHDMPNNGATVDSDAAEIARIAAKLKK